ncbi:MAG: hypothetical protein AB4042_12590 [Leptolyngbyaceae cyanobacterium]
MSLPLQNLTIVYSWLLVFMLCSRVNPNGCQIDGNPIDLKGGPNDGSGEMIVQSPIIGAVVRSPKVG